MLAFPTQSQWQTAAIANLRSTTYNDSDPKSRRTANLIVPRVYISDFFTARNETEMTKLGITHMISAMEHTPTTMPNVVRHLVPIADRWNANILKYLDGTTEFIRAALAENEDNKVLVCCWARPSV
jgi:atypical dual specificity phosphatase